MKNVVYRAVKYKAVNLNFILDTLKEAGSGINLVFLDACRNNPFRGARGLTRVAPPADTETLISYSTSANDVAADASSYTPTLAKLIKNKPHLSIETLLKKVKEIVSKNSGRRQNPDYTSSFGDRNFCFGYCSKNFRTKNKSGITKLFTFEPKVAFLKGGVFSFPCSVDCEGYGFKKTKNNYKVNINSFYMGKTEVTVKQYMACVKDKGCRNTEWYNIKKNYISATNTIKFSYKEIDKTLESDNYPIVGVSKDDAIQYALWLSYKIGRKYRLPTSTEWLFAANINNKTGYPWIR